MKHITIDNLEHIPESATFQDLRYLHGTGRSKTSIGAYGRKHSDYRFGAQTEIGDIEISVWEAAMHRLIRNSGERPCTKHFSLGLRRIPRGCTPRESASCMP